MDYYVRRGDGIVCLLGQWEVQDGEIVAAPGPILQCKESGEVLRVRDTHNLSDGLREKIVLVCALLGVEVAFAVRLV